MVDALRSWVLGIIGAALLTAVSMAVTPESKVKKVVTLVCGTVMALMLVKPVIGIDYSGLMPSLSGLRREVEGFSAGMAETNEKLSGIIIEEECAAYILDKGTAMGIDDLKVSVTVKWSGEGYWYPTAVRIKTNAERELRDMLGEVIITDLGIPPEELKWSMSDEE